MGWVGKRAPALAVARLVCALTAASARLSVFLLLVGCMAASLTACSPGGNGEKLGERVIPLGQPVPKGGGTYRVGSPYQVDGVWYRPQENPSYDRVGTASWYGELFHGRRTANGEIYDMDRLSAASPTLPLPVYARVTNLANGRSIIVRVNDRGPYRRGRVIDLSRRSAELLGFKKVGTARVRVQYAGRAPLNGDDSYERRYAASQGWTQIASGQGSRSRSKEPVAVGSLATVASRQVASGEAPRLRWRASAQAPARAAFASPSRRAPAPAGLFLIQAGSFRSQDNAERARSMLGGIAQVEVMPIEVGDTIFFRVRVGPFADRGAAVAALARVTKAGYRGAKIVTN